MSACTWSAFVIPLVDYDIPVHQLVEDLFQRQLHVVNRLRTKTKQKTLWKVKVREVKEIKGKQKEVKLGS